MKGLTSVRFLAVGFLCVIMVGCAAKAPPNGPGALNIAQFTLAQGAIGVQYQQLLIASGGQHPYTWEITDGSLPPSLTLTTDGIISGAVPCGAAQPPCPNVRTYNFTVKVTDSQSPTRAFDTKPESIQINPDLSLTSVRLPAGIVGTGYNATFTASDGVPPYTYSLAGDLPLPDGLSLVTTPPMQGMPNSAVIQNLPPSTGPTTAGVYTFTIQATDSAHETATAVFTITVTGRLQGPYILSLNGFDTTQPAGSQAFYTLVRIDAENDVNGTGSITGMIDQVGANATPTTGPVPISGFYSFPTGTNFGFIDFTRGDTNAGYQFNVVLSSQNDSKMVLSDPTNHVWGSGLLKKQTVTNISILGNSAAYSFGLFGNDSSGNRYTGAGMFNLTSGLAVTGGAQDTNDNGTASGEMPITGGSFTPDPPPPPPAQPTGRGRATLTVAGSPQNYIYYVVSAAELVALGADASPSPTTILDIQQQQTANPLSSGVVVCKHDTSCQTVLGLNGVSTSGGTSVAVAQVGVISFVASSDGNHGTIKRTDGLPAYYTDRSIGGTLDSVSFTGGDNDTYVIDPTCGPIMATCGRVTLTITGDSNPPVVYLFNTGQGFVVGTDASASQGLLQPQSPPTTGFDLTSFLGSYLGGSMDPTLPSITNQIGVAGTPPPGGVWQENFQTSGPGGPPQNPVSFRGPYGLDPTVGAALGRFAVCNGNATGYCTSFVYDPNSPPIDIFYVLGGGASGATGGKTGLVGINTGVPNLTDGTATVDPNPRVSTYGR